jgi:Carboxypeptidase regulatory-like domain
LALFAGLSAGGDKKKEPEAYSIVGGTVFRDPGFALPDATVALMASADPKAKKLQTAEVNYRGEFAFRVPAAGGTYVVKAWAKGYTTEQREATVAAGERIEVNLVLMPVKK